MEEIIIEILKLLEKGNMTVNQSKYILSETTRQLDSNSVIKIKK